MSIGLGIRLRYTMSREKDIIGNVYISSSEKELIISLVRKAMDQVDLENSENVQKSNLIAAFSYLSEAILRML